MLSKVRQGKEKEKGYFSVGLVFSTSFLLPSSFAFYHAPMAPTQRRIGNEMLGLVPLLLRLLLQDLQLRGMFRRKKEAENIGRPREPPLIHILSR